MGARGPKHGALGEKTPKTRGSLLAAIVLMHRAWDLYESKKKETA